MTTVAVLCDAPAHGNRVRAGQLPLGPSTRAASELRRLLGADPDPDRHRERHHFECTRCGDRVTIGRTETMTRVREELLSRGESSVTLSELRRMVRNR